MRNYEEPNNVNVEKMHETRMQLIDHPDRWEQGTWIYATYDTETGISTYAKRSGIPAEEIRPYLTTPLMTEPVDELRPICTSVMCVAGTRAVQSAPPGTRITNFGITFPDGSADTIPGYAQAEFGLTDLTAAWMFASKRTPAEVLNAMQWLEGHPDATFDTFEEVSLRGGF